MLPRAGVSKTWPASRFPVARELLPEYPELQNETLPVEGSKRASTSRALPMFGAKSRKECVDTTSTARLWES